MLCICENHIFRLATLKNQHRVKSQKAIFGKVVTLSSRVRMRSKTASFYENVAITPYDVYTNK